MVHGVGRRLCSALQRFLARALFGGRASVPSAQNWEVGGVSIVGNIFGFQARAFSVQSEVLRASLKIMPEKTLLT